MKPFWQQLQCQFTEARLDAYTRRELSVVPRRIIARHLDTCTECTHKLWAHQELTRTLHREVPRLGTPSNRQLNAMWVNIQRDLQRSEVRSPLRWREGATASVAALLLLAPLLLSTRVAPSPELANTVSVAVPVIVSENALTSTPEQELDPARPLATPPAPVSVALLQNTPDLPSDPIEGLP